MKNKYGLVTAITMVVGIIIGSGIFFTVDDILAASGENVIIAFIALAIGALSMLFGALVFATIAARSKSKGGLTEYMTQAYGKRAGYTMGFFQSTIYLPVITAILSWVSSMYLLTLLGFYNPENSPLTWIVAVVLLLGFYTLNYLKPLLAGKFQVYSTIASFVPLIFVALVATVLGIFRGTLQYNIGISGDYLADNDINFFTLLFTTVVITSFAYDGWLIATNISDEIKDSEKNLPRALIIGTSIVAVIYLLFFIGMVSFVKVYDVNDDSIMHVAVMILGNVLYATVAMGFIVISCLGTLNGLTLATIRAPQQVAAEGQGFKHEQLAKVNEDGMSKYSALYALVCTMFFLIILFGNHNGWYDFLMPVFGITEINLLIFAVVVLHVGYLMIYLKVMMKDKDLSFIKRFILPFFAATGAAIIIFGGILNSEILIGLFFSTIMILIAQKFYNDPNIEVSKHL